MSEQVINELITEIEVQYQTGAIGHSTYKKLMSLARELQL